MKDRRYITMSREPFFRLAASYAGGRALDVGAGDGAFADLLGDPDITLIEGNPESAAALESQYGNVIEMTLPGRFPVEDGAFDFIHCSHLIEHLYPDGFRDLLREFDRVLADHGRLVISTPVMWEHFYDDLSHIKPYNPRVLEHYLCKGGGQRTASQISDRYTVTELVWRWRVVPFPDLSVGYNRQFLGRILAGFSSLLRRANFGRLEKTGYTIVLTKG
jgi:SAM-dependent methyltransferase